MADACSRSSSGGNSPLIGLVATASNDNNTVAIASATLATALASPLEALPTATLSWALLLLLSAVVAFALVSGARGQSKSKSKSKPKSAVSTLQQRPSVPATPAAPRDSSSAAPSTMQAASAHTQARPCGSSDGKLEMPKLFTASELKAMFLAHETADQADAIHQIEMLERSPSDMQSWPAASCPFASMMSSRLATPPAQRPSENEDVQALQGCFNYLQDFLGKPHPALGRKGPTCPFVPTGLKKDSIYVGSVTTTPATTKDQIVELMRGFPDKFLQLEPRQGPLVSYKAIVVTFPYMSLADAPLLIDSVQNELKAEFVNKGLMIGEFHLANNASSLNNPDFFPLRTPKPCIAMRFMVPGDLVFMSLDQYPTSMRINLLESYISNLTSSGNPLSNKESDLVHTARVQLDAARSG